MIANDLLYSYAVRIAPAVNGSYMDYDFCNFAVMIERIRDDGCIVASGENGYGVILGPEYNDDKWILASPEIPRKSTDEDAFRAYMESVKNACDNGTASLHGDFCDSEKDQYSDPEVTLKFNAFPVTNDEDYEDYFGSAKLNAMATNASLAIDEYGAKDIQNFVPNTIRIEEDDIYGAPDDMATQDIQLAKFVMAISTYRKLGYSKDIKILVKLNGNYLLINVNFHKGDCTFRFDKLKDGMPVCANIFIDGYLGMVLADMIYSGCTSAVASAIALVYAQDNEYSHIHSIDDVFRITNSSKYKSCYIYGKELYKYEYDPKTKKARLILAYSEQKDPNIPWFIVTDKDAEKIEESIKNNGRYF